MIHGTTAFALSLPCDRAEAKPALVAGEAGGQDR